MKSDTISAALDSAFEMSVGPGLYRLSAGPFSNPTCGPNAPGLLCTSVYGVASKVDVDTQLSGRENRFPRGLYNAPPLPDKQETVASEIVPPPAAVHKTRGSLRGLRNGPAGDRIGREWLSGVDIQDERQFIYETTGYSRGGTDARQMAKDAVRDQ
jgi:hypothetical protein